MIWHRWKLWLALVCIFGAGVVVGGVVTIRIVQRQIAMRLDATQWSPRTMAWLSKELKLTGDQQRKIQPSVDKMAADLKQLMDDAEAERKGIFGKLLMEIHGDLTEVQQSELKTLIQKNAKGTQVRGSFRSSK